jgi:hypothetical protein
MKNTLLASVAFLVLGATTTFATVPALDLEGALSSAQQPNFLVLADSDGDSGKDNSGSGHSGGDDSDDNSRNDDSGRRRARVPGGSGCDDAGDVAEHAECRAQ